MNFPFSNQQQSNQSDEPYTLRPIWRLVGGVFLSPVLPAALIVFAFAVLEYLIEGTVMQDMGGVFLNSYLGLFMINTMLCLPTMIILSRITHKKRWFALAGSGCLFVFTVLAWGFLGAPMSPAHIIASLIIGAIMMLVLKKISRY